MNWITNFLFDKVNHCGRLCELISIAYLIKALDGVYMCVQVICQEHSRTTNLKGFLDDEQDVSLSM